MKLLERSTLQSEERREWEGERERPWVEASASLIALFRAAWGAKTQSARPGGKHPKEKQVSHNLPLPFTLTCLLHE